MYSDAVKGEMVRILSTKRSRGGGFVKTGRQSLSGEDSPLCMGGRVFNSVFHMLHGNTV